MRARVWIAARGRGIGGTGADDHTALDYYSPASTNHGPRRAPCVGTAAAANRIGSDRIGADRIGAASIGSNPKRDTFPRKRPGLGKRDSR